MTEKPVTYLTPAEAAKKLMIAPVTIRKWAHNGKLKSYTTPGGHRRFLDKDIEEFALMRAQKGSRQPSSKGIPRILVVDDDDQLRRMYQELLSTAPKNADIAVAADGFDAGGLIQSFRPDFVLLDLSMPGLDGFDVCQRIKLNKATRHIRVIAMTGYPSPENIARITDAGAETCLAKPVDNDTILKLFNLAADEVVINK
jgi:excisionase family DNA binding protein